LVAKQRSGYIADHLNKLSEQLLDIRPAVDAYITPNRVTRHLTAIADTSAPSTAASAMPAPVPIATGNPWFRSACLHACYRQRKRHHRERCTSHFPQVVAFLVAQRRFIEGITLTGLKG
jgi:hypothetical protein